MCVLSNVITVFFMYENGKKGGGESKYHTIYPCRLYSSISLKNQKINNIYKSILHNILITYNTCKPEKVMIIFFKLI